MSFGQLLDIIRARFLLILLTTAVTVAVAVAFSLNQPNRYLASTYLVLNLDGSSPFESNAVPAQLSATYLATQMDIMRSHKVALAVVDELKLDQEAGWKAAYAESEQSSPIGPWIASQIMQNLDVEPMQNSRVVSLSYEALQPEEAARIANAYAQGYIKTALELTREPARRNAAWFDEQVKTLRERLEEARGRITQLQTEKGIVALDERLSAETARLDDISRNLVQAQIEVSTARARQLGQNHPEYRAALQRERALLGALDAQKRNIQELQTRRDEIGTLEREVESEQKNYDATLQSYFQTAMQSQFNQTNIAVLSPAMPPARPSSPNLPLNVASAVVLGLFLGGVAAAFAELLSPRVETSPTRRRYVREQMTQA
jgi:polysaccharide biosynthesis transport protein